ncbi:cwf23 Pre-mRNA-splicing factor cwf23 [Candida maltosa Xu316]|uniref:DnaJ domain-containing protein (Dnaj-family protein, putative) n=1 Tax=Candida maltosa (strain Xu316) TaxID=1245528 RepID=M3JU19_CANMX|nr:DnaJ domain-containing protein (Dnaj-family protein, putative) [Candida maltosa Xu316]
MDGTISVIINNNVNIYDILEISNESTSQEIRRAYRQKALQYHPDKFQGDPSQFNVILKSYEILTNPQLKAKYDELYALKLRKKINRKKLDELTRKFQDELIASEEENKARQKRKYYNLEAMKEDGLKRRRIREQTLVNTKSSSVSIYDLPLVNNLNFEPSSTSNVSTTTVRLKYKYKKELKGLIDENVLTKIMQIFGPVKKVTMNGHDERYGYAFVEFESDAACQEAIQHNYNESAKRWDGTDVRKLASLLRECTMSETMSSGLTNNELVNQILQKFEERC